MKVRELMDLLCDARADDPEVGVFLYDRTYGVTHGEAVNVGRLDPRKDWGPGVDAAPGFTFVIHSGNVNPSLRPEKPPTS